MIHYVIHQLCHGQKVFVSVRRRTYRSSTHQKVRKYTEVGIFNPKTFSSFPETCKKMQNCINVTSLAAFQSADLLLNAVSESLRTGSGISKTLKDNRKIRGHFGFRTFEKKKTTARNGFSSTIQNDVPHTKSAVPASAKRPPELSQLFIQAARVALSRHVFFVSFFLRRHLVASGAQNADTASTLFQKKRVCRENA